MTEHRLIQLLDQILVTHSPPGDDGVAGYHLDDKLAIAIMQCAREDLRTANTILERDVFYNASSMEETGSQGAIFAARNIPGRCMVRLEIGPVAEEYGIQLNEKPVLWCGPGSSYHMRPGTNSCAISSRTERFAKPWIARGMDGPGGYPRL